MKLYRLTRGFKESYKFVIEGVVQEVLFANGARQPVKNNGYFTTNDKQLQKALEESEMFNDRYVLESDSLAKVKPDPIEEPKPEAPSEATIITEVTTWMQAASYFRSTYPELYNNKTTKAKVLLAMQQHNVIFPNWNL